MNETIVILSTLAHARSGDKGSNSNIGLIARSKEIYHFLEKNLDANQVANYFKSLNPISVKRYEIANLLAFNFVLEGVLDGGGSQSLRTDAQGKALAQALLQMPIKVPFGLIGLKEAIYSESVLVAVEEVGPLILKMTLKRHEKHHALNLEMVEALIVNLKKMEDTAQRVLIITGANGKFCTGLDLEELKDPVKSIKLADSLAALFKMLAKTPLVTIAAIDGCAAGGGAGLAAACDFLMMAKEAKIGFPEVQRGLVPAQVAAILIRQVSMHYLLELLLTGELISSHKAKQIGLVNDVVEKDDLESETLKLAKKIIKNSPRAIKETKRHLQSLQLQDFEKDLDVSLILHKEAVASDEAKEGIAAFLEKRTPRWVID